MTEANTGISYWLNIPAKDIHEWLELINDYYEQIQRKLKK